MTPFDRSRMMFNSNYGSISHRFDIFDFEKSDM